MSDNTRCATPGCGHAKAGHVVESYCLAGHGCECSAFAAPEVPATHEGPTGAIGASHALTAPADVGSGATAPEREAGMLETKCEWCNKTGFHVLGCPAPSMALCKQQRAEIERLGVVARATELALINAVNDACECGGSEPPGACGACAVWHSFKAALRERVRDPEGK